MSTTQVEMSAQINQSASKIYQAIADYRRHHPQFLPKNYFKKLEIEEGGIGAGTIFKADMEVFGNKSSFHMRVSEPQSGRVIQETDLNSGLVTTFTIDPLNTNSATVTIASQWQRPSGLISWLDSAMRSLVMKRIYKEELALMDQYVASL